MTFTDRIFEKIRLNRYQRLLLFGSVTLWFLSAAISVQRNYEDNWILEGVFWPFVGLVITFLIVLWMENDNRWVAILCTWAVIILSLVPSLKYVQVYGQAVDQVMHYQMINSLITTGRVSSQQPIYQAIAGMHSWLASMGITGDLSATEITKIGFPLSGGIMPLLIYWICHRIMMPSNITKNVIALSCLATFPYHAITGTGFTLIPLVVFLNVLILREYFCTSISEKFIYTLLALIVLAQLMVWHSTSPLMLLILLVSASLTPVLVWFATGRNKKVGVNIHFLHISLLATILILGYHAIVVDPVFKIVFSRIYEAVVAELGPATIVPTSTLHLTLNEVLDVFLLMYGREAILFSLAGLGLLVIWHHRANLDRLLYYYAYLSMIFVPFIFAVPLNLLGLDFKRLLWIPLTFSPFFAGYVLWWWNQRWMQKSSTYRWLSKAVELLLILVAVGIIAMEFYAYQPLIPKSKSLTPDTPDEYVVWLHQVNTAYQQRMITFAETFSNPETRFDIDILGNRQYVRYYGGTRNRGLYLPLAPFMGWVDRRNSTKEKLFLLHWPGKAGGFGEKVQDRSVKNLTALRNTIGWGLIYDNGESFILQIPGSYP